jgi:histidine triad (HIT) family protein
MMSASEREQSTRANCSFCRIATGDVEAAIVLDEPHALAFLDHRPLFPGHCLLIPRRHQETLTDLPQDEVGPLFETTQLLTRAVREAMDAQGTFVAINNVVSQSVPHFHVHVVPRRRKDGLRGFFWPRTKYESEEQLAEVRELIRDAVARLH